MLRVAGVTGRTPAQPLRVISWASAANHTPVSHLVPDPSNVPSQHGVLVPEHQQLSILGRVSAQYQDSEAKDTAH
jgi:hypothetical protein